MPYKAQNQFKLQRPPVNYLEIIEEHRELEKAVFDDLDGREYRDRIRSLLVAISDMSLITSLPVMRKTLKNIFDRWALFGFSRNWEFGSLDFHDNLTYWTNYDVRGLVKVIAEIIEKSDLEDIKGKNLQIPRRDLIWDKIVNVYGNGFFISISLKEEGYSAKDIVNEFNNIYREYLNIFKEYKIHTYYFLTLNIQDDVFSENEKMLTSFLEKAKVTTAVEKLSEVIHNDNNHLRFSIHRLNPDAGGKVYMRSTTILKSLQDIIDDSLQLLYGYTSLYDEADRRDNNDLERIIDQSDKAVDIIIKKIENNLFNGIAATALIKQILKENVNWHDESYFFKNFDNIGKEDLGIGDNLFNVVKNAIYQAGPYLDRKAIIDVYRRLEAMDKVLELYRNESNKPASEYYRLQGIIADFWVKKLVKEGHTEFNKLSGLIFYVFYLKEVGRVFFKLFADYQYMLFRDFYFRNAGAGPTEVEVERRLFDGLSHYNISALVFKEFQLPEVFYY